MRSSRCCIMVPEQRCPVSHSTYSLQLPLKMNGHRDSRSGCLCKPLMRVCLAESLKLLLTHTHTHKLSTVKEAKLPKLTVFIFKMPLSPFLKRKVASVFKCVSGESRPVFQLLSTFTQHPTRITDSNLTIPSKSSSVLSHSNYTSLKYLRTLFEVLYFCQLLLLCIS